MPLTQKDFLSVARLRRGSDKKGSYILSFLEHSFPITAAQIRVRRDFMAVFWDNGVEAPSVPPLGPRYDNFAGALLSKLYCKVAGERVGPVIDKLMAAEPSLRKEDLLTGSLLALKGKMHLYPAALLRESRRVDPAITTHDVSHAMREMGWYRSSVRVGKDTYGVWTREQTSEESDRFAFEPDTDLRAPGDTDLFDDPDLDA